MKDLLGKKLLIAAVLAAAILATITLIKSMSVNIGGKIIRSSELTVDLSGMGLTDISDILKLKRPETIDLTGNTITIEQYETAKEKFPYCEIKWDIPLSYGYYNENIEYIKAQSFSEDDIDAYRYFKCLKGLDISDVDITEYEYKSLKSVIPSCDIIWTVNVSGVKCISTSDSLKVAGNGLNPDEFIEALYYLQSLTQVEITDCEFTAEQQRRLTAQFPQISFYWGVELLGERYPCNIENLSFSEISDSNLGKICENADLFTSVKKIDLGDRLVDVAIIKNIRDSFNGAEVICSFSFRDRKISTMETELDFSNTKFNDVYVWDDIVKVMPDLQKVVMCDCGVDNETMDMLNHRYEGVKFVWRVYVTRYYPMRTDATYFCCSDRPDDGYIGLCLTDEEIDPIKYCTDMTAMDLGHMYLTNIDFVKNMKNLQYLVISCNDVTDISAISNCKELAYMEMFCNIPEDISPLLECKKLEYLNIGNCTGFDPSPLYEMTSLKYLWYSENNFTDKEAEELQKALPETVLYLTKENRPLTGWKELQGYYDMRDIFGMFY